MDAREHQPGTTTANPEVGRCPVAHVAWSGPARTPLDGYAMLDQLRDDGPLHYVPDGSSGFYLVTDHDLTLGIAQDVATFPQPSHLDNGDPMPFLLIPENLNGPEHTKWRRLLAPHFSPGRIDSWDSRIRHRAAVLIDGLVGRGECDFVRDFALRYPTAIFLEIMGLPAEHLDMLLEWETAILHPAGTDAAANLAQMQTAQVAVTGYFADVIARRREVPAAERVPGLVTEALDWRIDGEPVSDDELLRFYLLMFMAGLDTVTAELGYGFLHLATHPQDRHRLATEPGVADHAVEELLRAYPIVNVPREVVRETEIAGCPVKPGDFVILSYPSAGRDDSTYPSAREVDFDRDRTTHLTFGAGPHRCLGSHLARHELLVAYQEWHRRIPDYELRPTAPFSEAAGGMMTLNSLPLQWATS